MVGRAEAVNGRKYRADHGSIKRDWILHSSYQSSSHSGNTVLICLLASHAYPNWMQSKRAKLPFSVVSQISIKKLPSLNLRTTVVGRSFHLLPPRPTEEDNALLVSCLCHCACRKGFRWLSYFMGSIARMCKWTLVPWHTIGQYRTWRCAPKMWNHHGAIRPHRYVFWFDQIDRITCPAIACFVGWLFTAKTIKQENTFFVCG